MCGVWWYVVWCVCVYIVAQSIHLNRDLWRVILESSSTAYYFGRVRSRALIQTQTHITRNRFPWMLKLYATHNIPHRANPIPFLEQTHTYSFLARAERLRILLCFIHRTLFVWSYVSFVLCFVRFIQEHMLLLLFCCFCEHLALIVLIYGRINWLLSVILFGCASFSIWCSSASIILCIRHLRFKRQHFVFFSANGSSRGSVLINI